MTCRLVACLAVLAVLAPAADARGRSGTDAFVVRSGSRLELAGRPFRFGGANIEWLGLLGYGPADPAGPRPPSHFEIDDALATARMLGATVVRSQTLVDSVGCAACIEPSLGVFDERAFESSDYALASARAHGLKVIATIVGDDAADGGTGCVYLRWRDLEPAGCSLLSMDPFWSDPVVIGDVEAHIAAVLNHVNVYTHVAYKDDPTILGWDLLNGGGSPVAWTKQIAGFVRSVDPRHLILSGYANAGLAAVDACVSFVYPHWGLPYAEVRQWIAQCAKHDKPYLVYEYGWDRTNFPTRARLRGFLATLQRNPDVAGDAFWALEAHADGHGWLPIPADVTDPAQAATVETGEWWALYYPGIRTLVTTVADMRARAETIRAHDYAMRGLHVPAHPVPPSPTITSVQNGRVYWQGSAGARAYTVQRAPRAAGPWQTICRECATDVGNGYLDASAVPGAWYRVIAFNVDGRPSRPSPALRASAGWPARAYRVRRSGRARWPSRSSKPVRACSPRVGQFDSGAAPSLRFPCISHESRKWPSRRPHDQQLRLSVRAALEREVDEVRRRIDGDRVRLCRQERDPERLCRGRRFGEDRDHAALGGDVETPLRGVEGKHIGERPDAKGAGERQRSQVQREQLRVPVTGDEGDPVRRVD